MNKIYLFSLLFILSCTSDKIEPRESLEFSKNYEICKLGCNHLESLYEEGATEKGCQESKPVGELSCTQFCAQRLTSEKNSIFPKCWTQLKACSDFEEQCNNGDLYPYP